MEALVRGQVFGRRLWSCCSCCYFTYASKHPWVPKKLTICLPVVWKKWLKPLKYVHSLRLSHVLDHLNERLGRLSVYSFVFVFQSSVGYLVWHAKVVQRESRRLTPLYRSRSFLPDLLLDQILICYVCHLSYSRPPTEHLLSSYFFWPNHPMDIFSQQRLGKKSKNVEKLLSMPTSLKINPSVATKILT